MMPAPRPSAVVMGLSPTGLHVVRALGSTGIDVTGVADGFQAGRLSRYLRRCIVANSAQARLEALCGLFPETAERETGRPVLIPTSDQDVQFVLDHAARLARHYAMQESYRNGLAAQILSKDSFYRLCAERGVAFPALWNASREDLPRLLPEIVFPCIVKPARIHELKHGMRGRKVWIAKDEHEFHRVAGDIPADAGTLIVQQIVPGPESNISLCCLHMDSNGAARQTFTARKLRQYPPGFGSASLAQSTPDPEAERISLELLSSLGYSGIAALEFKRDPNSGRLTIIEVNVRPSLWFALSAASGREVVLSAFHELAGGSEPLPERPQRQGVRWRYLMKDLASAQFYRTHPGFVLPAPEIGAVGAPSARVGAVFTRSDPAPAIGELINFAAKFVSRAFGPHGRGGKRAAA